MKQVQSYHLLANLDLTFPQRKAAKTTTASSARRRFDNRGCAGRARSGSLHVHEPRYETQNYGVTHHQDSLLGGHGLGTIDYGLVTIDLPDRRPEE